MVSLIAIVPLLATLMVCSATALYALKRKSLAQSLCIHQATRTQQDLKSPLDKLIKLNTKATSLRNRRLIADANLISAQATGYPPAILAAKAQQTAVILQQYALRARQLALLADAEGIRVQANRDIRQKIERFPATQIRTESFYFRPLAVEPKPPTDLSPNYETVPAFTTFQQHRFRYQIDLLQGMPSVLAISVNSLQKIECAVSLEEQGDDWNLRILAARAP